MKKSSKIFIASVLTLGIAGGAFAFGSHHYFSKMDLQEKADMVNYRISRKLDLNSEQVVNLELLTGRVADIIKQVKQERHSHEMLVEQLITDQPLDQTELLTKINQKTALVNEYAPEVVSLLAGFVDSLDAEQKATVKELIEKRRGRHSSHHGRWSD